MDVVREDSKEAAEEKCEEQSGFGAICGCFTCPILSKRLVARSY